VPDVIFLPPYLDFLATTRHNFAMQFAIAFDWRILLTALGLAFILEGLPYFMLAERMPEVLRTLAERRPRTLRLMGMAAIALGLSVIAVARR
jgi:hypothetical protein